MGRALSEGEGEGREVVMEGEVEVFSTKEAGGAAQHRLVWVAEGSNGQSSGFWDLNHLLQHSKGREGTGGLSPQ